MNDKEKAVTTLATPPRRTARSWALGFGLLAYLVFVASIRAEGLPAQGKHIGIRSLLPAVTTLVLVFLTRDVISALFLGVVTGGLVSGQFNIIQSFLLPSIGSESYATILLVYLWALGGLIGLWTRTGGAQAFAHWAGSKLVRGPRSASFFAWLMGVVFHQGGTISTILAGTTVRPVTDAHKVSHEELTYVVDSTASPVVASIIPFNAWPLYVAGLVTGTTPLFANETESVAFFFRSIRYNFYGIFALAFTLLFALNVLPFVGGKMRRARERARTTGALDGPHAKPLLSSELSVLKVPAGYHGGLIDFLLPMGVLLGVAIVPYFVTGKVRIGEAFGLALIAAVLLALIKGMRLSDVIEGFIDGCKGVTVGAIVLGLAVTLGLVSKKLGTGSYIVETVSGSIPPTLLPAILMGSAMAISFSVGSSWGTYAVLFPIAMPLAYALHPDPAYISICFGAVMGGSVFGDQCSPISDTTILSALACGADVMDHVTTQLPLALGAAGLATLVSTVAAFLVL